ncbi:MAG: hypothetical protein E7258_01430 [Lachnospiraceae bacterium]|nr:hypothetical protein [Lachnospiraceae bacterium]
MTKIREMDFNRWSIFIFSVIAASVITNLFIRCGFDFSYMQLLYNENDVSQISYTTTTIYVIIKRLKHIIVISLFMMAIKPEFVFSALTILLGFMYGGMATVQTYYIGISGLLQLIIMIIPHYIIYTILIYELMKMFSNKINESNKVGKLLFLLSILCLGIVFEGTFSRFFLERFNQYIVSGI